jgi:leucyl-tRNA---protein transferase
MESLFRFVAPPSSCGYLPDQTWRLEYEFVRQMSPAEYHDRLLAGWRRFGSMLFRPRCPGCTACQSLRVDVERFQPNRSQRRCRAANLGTVELRIGQPAVTPEKIDLYDRYHAFQANLKGWPHHGAKDADEYARSFVDNPFPTQEWCFFVAERLVGVGYVDDLPGALSAIYFFYDPEERQRSLGTWNVLCQIEHAAGRSIPFLYLGYFVEGCRSMAYKAKFVPNQVLRADGKWHDFQTG